MNEYYIDNKKFYEAMIDYIDDLSYAKKHDKEPSNMSEYLGECFLNISSRLVYKNNFINYTFRDDFISDGIENCILYAHNFNYNKSKNPFSYFTQIVYYSFVRRIKKERRQMQLKYRIIEKNDNYNEYVTINDIDNVQFQKQIQEYLKQYEKYGTKEPKKSSKKMKTNNLIQFIK